MRKEIKNKILKGKNCSEECVTYIKTNKNLSKDDFAKVFTNYLCYKFFLEPQEIKTDDFYEICQFSVDKTSKLPPGTIDASEAASKCGGATTAMNKKILFLLAIRRELDVHFSGHEGASIDTLSQLIDLIYKKLMNNNQMRDG